MKLFIWNDLKWDIVDENTKYDTNNYVVVRKLMIYWFNKTKSYNAKTNEIIRQKFEKFGAIESVTTVDDLSQEKLDERIVHQACVVFVNSYDAYKAFLANRIITTSKEIICVLPSTSWSQPNSQNLTASNGLTCAFDFKHQRGHENVKKYDVSEVSKLFDTLNCRQFNLEYTMHIDEFLTLNQIRKVARSIATRVKALLIDYDPEFYEHTYKQNSISFKEYNRRLLSVIATNVVGEYLDCLTVLQMNFTCVDQLETVTELLKPLKNLSIEGDSECYIVYALKKFCPNLVGLNAVGIGSSDCFSKIDVEHWPSLKRLHLMSPHLNITNYTKCGKKFRRFIIMNKQLELLELLCAIDNKLLGDIAANLINLTTLKITVPTPQCTESMIDALKGCNNLSSMTITFSETEKKNFQAIPNVAQLFTPIKNLRFISLYFNYISQKCCHVSIPYLPVDFSEYCPVHQSDRKFISIGPMIPDIEIPTDRQVFMVLVNTMESTNALKGEIQSIFDGIDKVYPHLITSAMTKHAFGYFHFHVSSAY